MAHLVEYAITVLGDKMFWKHCNVFLRDLVDSICDGTSWTVG